MLNCSSLASKMGQVLTSMARILVKLTFEIIIFYARGVEGQLSNDSLAKFCQKKKNITRLL
jgi:hypothetical protein